MADLNDLGIPALTEMGQDEAIESCIVNTVILKNEGFGDISCKIFINL